jgi:hypothetical protein
MNTHRRIDGTEPADCGLDANSVRMPMARWLPSRKQRLMLGNDAEGGLRGVEL